MSTFLELVNEVRSGADAAGPDLTTLAGTLPLGDRRIMRHVNEAWSEIQGLHDGKWKFLRLSASSPLTAGVRDYAASGLTPAISSFRSWKMDSFRLRTTGDYGDESFLTPCPWDTFRDTYLFGASRATPGRPTVFAVDPQRKLYFDVLPTANWTVECEYWCAQQTLSADTDVPIMPSDFHRLIVYRALLLDGEFEHSEAQQKRALRGARRLTAALELDQLEPIEITATTG